MTIRMCALLPLAFLTATTALAESAAPLPVPTCNDSYGTVIDYCVCQPTKTATYDTWTLYRIRKVADGTSLKDRLSVQFDDIACNQDLAATPLCLHPLPPPAPVPPG